MKKHILKLLSLGMLLTLASCSTGGNESSSALSSTPEPSSGESSSSSESSSESSSSSEAPVETNATILKQVGDDLFDYFGANRDNLSLSAVKHALHPVEETYRGPERKIPAVLVYMAGVLSDIDGVDLVNKAFEFDGEYEMDMSISETPSWAAFNIGFTLYVTIDKPNSRLFVGGQQRLSMPSNPMVNSTPYFFIDISYNYETKTLGDFKLYMDQNGTFYYFEVTSSVASIMGTETTETERTALEAVYNNNVTTLNTLTTSAGTKVVATGATLRAAQEAYVSTQKYQNRLYGQKIDSVRIKEAA